MSKEQEKKVSKRQAMREKRKQQEQRRRLITLGVILVVAAAMVFFLIIPVIQEMTAPAEEFVQITPVAKPMADGLAMGDPNAPVKLDLFEDFQCSACRGYSEYIETQVASDLVATGQVYYVFHNFPFMDDQSSVKDSDNAAMGAMCAAEQNMFWEFKDILFTNYGEWGFTSRRLSAFAESLGLNTKEFDACMKEKRYQAEIDADMALGDAWGVNGTPSLFVDGVIITPGYVPNFDQIKAAVEGALANK